MATNPEALRLCRMLAVDTGRQPQQWRTTVTIAARARLRDPGTVQKAVAFALKQGWLEKREGNSICLTEAGRNL